MNPNELLKLFACCAGVFGCYLFYGVFQERVTRGHYVHGEKFHFAASLVFLQCVTSSIFARSALLVKGNPSCRAPWYIFVLAAGSYVAAMLCSNMSLQFVPYPTQVLVKSCKPVSVMLFGFFLAGKRYSLSRLVCVLLIVSGAAIFLYPRDKPAVAKMEGSELLGSLLLFASLVFDGVTGALQEKTNAYSVHTYQLMYRLNIWSTLYLGAGLAYLGEVPEFIAFVGRNPPVVKDIVAFCILSCVGQVFIFTTITTFGSLVCSLVTTTRKFFTIVASLVLFGNRLVAQQWLGVVLVFSGLFIEGWVKRQQSSKPKPVENGKKVS